MLRTIAKRMAGTWITLVLFSTVPFCWSDPITFSNPLEPVDEPELPGRGPEGLSEVQVRNFFNQGVEASLDSMQGKKRRAVRSVSKKMLDDLEKEMGRKDSPLTKQELIDRWTGIDKLRPSTPKDRSGKPEDPGSKQNKRDLNQMPSLDPEGWDSDDQSSQSKLSSSAVNWKSFGQNEVSLFKRKEQAPSFSGTDGLRQGFSQGLESLPNVPSLSRPEANFGGQEREPALNSVLPSTSPGTPGAFSGPSTQPSLRDSNPFRFGTDSGPVADQNPAPAIVTPLPRFEAKPPVLEFPRRKGI